MRWVSIYYTFITQFNTYLCISCELDVLYGLQLFTLRYIAVLYYYARGRVLNIII